MWYNIIVREGNNDKTKYEEDVNMIIPKTVADMMIQTEVTLVTKKQKKEIKVYVCDIWDGKTIVAWYTNRFGKEAIKHFDVNEYDIVL